jgi:glyoxylase-like metal-dependent hydrolase (beta-lactamase superfamily II)
MHAQNRWSSSVGFLVVVAGAVGLGCAHPAPPPPVSRNLDQEALEQAVRFKNPAPQTVVALANQYLATGRVVEGHTFFCERATQAPKQAVFGALCGLFQARMSSTISLLQRSAWVEEGMAKLDRAAASDGLSRYFRGLVSAELPAGFGRAQQATEDLEWVLAHPKQFPPGLRRAAYVGLSHAYRTLGKSAESEQALAPVGGPRVADSPVLQTNFSVNPRDGFRFIAPAVVEVAPGIHVAQGYDFADMGFIITEDQVVAIDAGTSEANARAALTAFRNVSDKPIRTVILTHAHWDHIGGLRAFEGPGVEVIGQSHFAEELALSTRAKVPFHYFFGESTPVRLEVRPTRLVAKTESLAIGGTRLVLHPAHGGETADALLIELPDRGVVFVGDAFMPYLGAPFVPEGSVEGLLDTIVLLRSLKPKLLIHGHPPLNENFTPSVLEPLEIAMRALYRQTEAALAEGKPLAEALGSILVPAELERYPEAVSPFLLMREGAIKRLYQQRTGYWKADGEGMEVFSRKEQAAAIDLVAGGDAEQLARAADSLSDRGDFALSLQIADLGLATHPSTPSLSRARARALDGLRSKYQLFNPFKFIVYSELAGADLPPPP